MRTISCLRQEGTDSPSSKYYESLWNKSSENPARREKIDWQRPQELRMDREGTFLDVAVFWSVLERPPTESHELIQKISRQQNQERPAFSSPGLGKGQPCRSLMPSRAAVTWQASSTPPLCHTGSAAELAEPSLGPRAAQTPRPSVGRVQGRPSLQPRVTGASSAGTGPGVPGPPPRDREPPRAGVLSDPLEPAARLHWQGFWSFRVTRRMKLTRITLKGL